MRPKLLIRLQWGLGDNIFHRPFIREVARRYKLYLDTPWPEVFEDFDIRFVRSSHNLRTQTKNQALQPADRWVKPPPGIREEKIRYGGSDLDKMPLVKALEKRYLALGIVLRSLQFDLPDFGSSSLLSDGRPLAVIRPVTIRKEWRNEARNPLPEYVAWVAAELRKTHCVVMLADTSPDHEWMVKPYPPHDIAFIHGELNIKKTLALIATADVVVGGVGWILPAAIALQTKAFIILGGHGAHNAPEKVTDPRLDLSRIGFATPERFCLCNSMLHNCNKQIKNLSEQWNDWRTRVCLNSVPSEVLHGGLNEELATTL